MYNLWKSKGTYVYPLAGGMKLYFNKARHSQSMKMPLDWPRISQFPEWFTVDPGKKYRISD